MSLPAPLEDGVGPWDPSHDSWRPWRAEADTAAGGPGLHSDGSGAAGLDVDALGWSAGVESSPEPSTPEPVWRWRPPGGPRVVPDAWPVTVGWRDVLVAAADLVCDVFKRARWLP